MTEIIELHKHIFPVGAVAYHPIYRSCKILKVEGLQRKIRYGVIDRQELTFKATMVPIKDLSINQHQEN